jgi:voltage-gated potassium channel Kch
MALLQKTYPIYHFFAKYKILVLFISILLIILVPPFLSRDSLIEILYLKINFLLVAISAYFIIHKVLISRYISIITFIIILLGIFIPNQIFDYISQIGLSVLIIHAFIEVLREAMSLKGKTKNLILVSITGYLIIGLIGGFLSAFLEFIYPNSFYHTTGIELQLYNFIYYGYVTMTTLGYGDIIPVTEKSQALALLLVISGQLFLTVIMAINIAKIMQSKMK